MDNFTSLKQDIRLLGRLLGDTIKEAHGAPLYEKVEQIRQLSKSSRCGNEADRESLGLVLHSLTEVTRRTIMHKHIEISHCLGALKLSPLSDSDRNTLQRRLPITASPVRFVSWMGGDRDGNPNVTAGK